MEMIYQVLADLTVAVHFAYVAFVVLAVPLTLLGGWIGWRWVRNRWFRFVHLAMIGIVVVEAWFGITCPLTRWENELRHAAGSQTYDGDFVATWLHDVLFFDAQPWVFTSAYSVFGLLVLVMLICVPPQKRATV